MLHRNELAYQPVQMRLGSGNQDFVPIASTTVVEPLTWIRAAQQ